MATAPTHAPAGKAGPPSPAERSAAGKTARERAPRSSHGAWAAAAGRPDPVEALERQAAHRVPELVPLRYARMLVSPFTFYRGAAAIMAADLATTPSSGLWVQACGDAHLSNFGAYASPDRELVVDINDFDETLPGPWEWDLKRLATSFEVAGRDRGLDRSQRRDAVLAAARSYRETIRRLARMGNLDVWYQRLDVAQVREAFETEAGKKQLERFDRWVSKTRHKDRLRAFDKLTHRVDGELRIKSDPPVLVPVDELFSGEQGAVAEARIETILKSYRATLAPERRHLLDTYRYIHAARKVVGVGSVGTRTWIALFIGRDEEDPLFLQVKEAQPSVLEPFAPATAYAHQGQRVVEGQRLIQATSGIMLGWLTAEGPDGLERDFYVRQLWDQKGSAAVELMSAAQLTIYAELCGAILGRAHARSGDRIAIAAYLGSADKVDRAIAEFARRYADRNERDFEALRRAARDGRVDAEADPA